MVSGGNEIPHCALCGLVLDDLKGKTAPSQLLETIMVAEDSPLLRQMVSDLLLKQGIAKTVVPSSNGQEFLALFTDRLRKNLAVNLAVLDVNMPIIDGMNAAKTLRALEEGFKRTRKTPILFFSVVKCDDNFRKFLTFCKPSAYLNKGTSGAPEELARRVVEVITRLVS